MILRTIRVQGWRCLADPVEVGPFSERLNVLHAPNATGKSTLFEALLRGLLDSHGVSGREVAALRPWGRALAPTVTVEFAHGGVEYRLTKRFLDRPLSELERQEGGRFVRMAEGDAADEKVRGEMRSLGIPTIDIQTTDSSAGRAVTSCAAAATTTSSTAASATTS